MFVVRSCAAFVVVLGLLAGRSVGRSVVRSNKSIVRLSVFTGGEESGCFLDDFLIGGLFDWFIGWLTSFEVGGWCATFFCPLVECSVRRRSLFFCAI